MSKKAIVNLVNERGNYRLGQERLRQSLQGKTDADFFGFTSEEEVGAPPHLENPYAFKIYAIEKVIKMGYNQILWLDASVYAIKDLKPIWDKIEDEDHGYIMQDIGHVAGNWANDKCLELFEVSRDEAMNIKCYGNAGFLGLNFNDVLVSGFFAAWKYTMSIGLFKGEWNNDNKTESQDERCWGHRHDLVCGSIIAHKFGMKLEKGDEWLQYAAPEDTPNNETVCLFAQGM